MNGSDAAPIDRAVSGAKTWALAPALLCLAFAGCSIRSTGLNTNVVRDNGKVYTYRAGVVRCDDGRKIPYHPTDYEKEVGFSLPSICDYH